MSRRWIFPLLGMTLALSACQAFRDAFATHDDVAASAGPLELRAEVLGEYVGSSPDIPVGYESLLTMANLWIDYSLLGLASADGDSLADSATAASASWARISERTVERFHEWLIGKRPDHSDSAFVRAEYHRGEYRFLEHILGQAGPSAPDEARADLLRRMNDLQQRMASGTSFRDAVPEQRDDTAQIVRRTLGVFAPGQTVSAFQDAAWALSPGAVSGIVETEFGYHLIRRPRLDEVYDEFRAGLMQRVSARLDSTYLDSLQRIRRVTVRPDGPALARDAVRRLQRVADSKRRLATYKGGALTVGDFARWMQGYARDTRGQLMALPDSNVAAFLEELASNQLLLEEARASGVTLAASDWDEIRTLYLSQLGALRRGLGVDPAALADSAATPAGRRAVVGERVDRYLREVVANERSLVEPLAFLTLELRQRYPTGIEAAGLDRALFHAQVVRARARRQGQAGRAPAQQGRGDQ